MPLKITDRVELSLGDNFNASKEVVTPEEWASGATDEAVAIHLGFEEEEETGEVVLVVQEKEIDGTSCGGGDVKSI